MNDPATPSIVVMTRNMYLGADVDRVIAALSGSSEEDPQAALEAVLQEFIATDPPTRLNALAGEIARFRPHVVGLQEVSGLSVNLPPEFGVPPFQTDFLAGLMQALAARGLSYQVITNQNFRFSLFGGAIVLQDSDALLIDSRLPILSSAGATFSCGQLCIPLPGLGTLKRGWVRARTQFSGRTVTFVSTHPESGEEPRIAQLRAGQMQELMGLLQTVEEPIVLMGDLNDTPGSAMHQVVTGAGFVDVWASLRPSHPGYTCCHATHLQSGSFDHRIDYVMVRGGFLNGTGRVVRGAKVQIVGESSDERIQGAFGLIWPSDHGGVVVTLPPAQTLIDPHRPSSTIFDHAPSCSQGPGLLAHLHPLASAGPHHQTAGAGLSLAARDTAPGGGRLCPADAGVQPGRRDGHVAG
ncbi:MAG TPA: endonuclease/exonuclease/phosphatase family protein [Gemmatimonadales bacterium]